MAAIRLLWALVRMELRGYFTSPLVYGAAAIYMLLSQGLAFRVLLDSHLLTMAPYYQTGSYLMVLLALAVSSGRLVRGEPSLEFLSYRPVSIQHIVWSRMVAGLVFVSLMAFLGLTLPVAVSLAGWGSPDVGAALTGALGLVLLGLVSWSVGLFTSSLTGSQTMAFVLGLIVMFLLWLPYQLVESGLGVIEGLVYQMSFPNHVRELARGLVTFRALFYFLGLACIVCRASQVALSSRTVRNPYAPAVPATAFLFFLLILSSLGTWTPRWDFTSRRVYTLSGVTVSQLAALDRDVKAIFVRPRRLPPELTVLADEVSYFLQMYDERSPRFSYAVAYTDTEEGRRIAHTYKLNKVKVLIHSGDESKELVIQFGIVLVSGEKAQTVPRINGLEKLEYQVTSALRAIMRGKKRILFTSGHGEFPDPKRQSLRGGFGKLQDAVSSYEFGRYDLSLDDVSSDASMLVVAGPIKPLSPEKAERIKTFIRRGRPVLFLIDGLAERHETSPKADPRAPFQWLPNTTGLDDLLAWLGVKVNHDMVLSSRAYAPMEHGRSGAPFPLMPIVRVRGFSVPVAPFTVSTVQAVPSPRYRFHAEMFVDSGWRHENAYALDPSWPKTRIQEHMVVGAYLEPLRKGLGRVYVIGDSDLFRDRSILGPHIDLFVYLAEKLTEDPRLGKLKIRGTSVSYLKVSGHASPEVVVGLSLSLPLVLLMLFGWLYNWRLRRRHS